MSRVLLEPVEHNLEQALTANAYGARWLSNPEGSEQERGVDQMAEIKINKQQWDSVAQADRDKITKGLQSAGALKAEDQIVGDPSITEMDKATYKEPQGWDPIKDICKAACDSAAAAGAAWCSANTAGVGLAACLAAAESARRECRRRC